jgi:hypothetical protein|tara:strand:+ start:221 stop:535 length:315 start_codon:yes stop_codon:yes gene_type:complete
MQNSGGSKNFLGKNLQFFSGSGNIYDFTYHKLNRMVDQLYRWDPGHPDILVLNNILELYIDGDVQIYWAEGYPLPYPVADTETRIEFDDELYEELSNMGLLEED